MPEVYNGAIQEERFFAAVLKTAVQFGAGNIGRGFTGQLFSEAGLEVVFVDVVPEIVQALNERRGYTITIAAEPEEQSPVRNVRAVSGRDIAAVAEEIANASVACTAVGVNVLESIATALAQGLELRRSRRPGETLNVIVCENMRDAAGALRQMVEQRLSEETAAWSREHVGFAQAVVGRMVPVRTPAERAADPLGIRVEAYKRLPVDADALKGTLAPIAGVEARGNFEAYIDQKLFAHNAGHAASAYYGFQNGLTYIWECMEDPDVRRRTFEVMQETGRALIEHYGLDADEHWRHIHDLLGRFANRKLGDTVARVGGDPLRKLSREDRLVGAALFCEQQGVEPVNVARAIAAGLAFRNPEDPSAAKMGTLIDSGGLRGALEDITGVAPDSPLGRRILREYDSASAVALRERTWQ